MHRLYLVYRGPQLPLSGLCTLSFTGCPIILSRLTAHNSSVQPRLYLLDIPTTLHQKLFCYWCLHSIAHLYSSKFLTFPKCATSKQG